MRGVRNVFFDRKKAPQIVEWIFRSRHLSQVIAPGIGLQSAARESLPCHRDNLTAGIFPGVADGGYNETHLRALLPKTAGKGVGEDERVITRAITEQFQSLAGAGPLRLDIGLKPSAEFKTVGLRLTQQDAEHCLARHC